MEPAYVGCCQVLKPVFMKDNLLELPITTADGEFIAHYSEKGLAGLNFPKKGDLRLVLLALIADKPSHGYDLIRTIEAKFGGAYAPSPGTVYPTLTLLEEQDLIASEPLSGGKKSYAVTAAGQQFLASNASQIEAVMTRIDIMAKANGGPMLPASIMHAVHTLRHAIFAKAGSWTAEEEAHARSVLERAARDIIGGPDAR